MQRLRYKQKPEKEHMSRRWMAQDVGWHAGRDAAHPVYKNNKALPGGTGGYDAVEEE